MQIETPDGWQTTYRFQPKRVEWIDYEAANWFTSTYPESIFLHNLIACRVLPDGRAALRNTTLTIRDAAGVGRTVTFDDAAAWGACLRDTIGIDTTDSISTRCLCDWRRAPPRNPDSRPISTAARTHGSRLRLTLLDC